MAAEWQKSCAETLVARRQAVDELEKLGEQVDPRQLKQAKSRIADTEFEEKQLNELAAAFKKIAATASRCSVEGEAVAGLSLQAVPYLIIHMVAKRLDVCLFQI